MHPDDRRLRDIVDRAFRRVFVGMAVGWVLGMALTFAVVILAGLTPLPAFMLGLACGVVGPIVGMLVVDR